MAPDQVLPSSFRDPSGFLFRRQGTLYRQVNAPYRADYEQLLASGLYADLVANGLLITHEEAQVEPAVPGAYKVLRPEPLPFVSYPYEWSFGQLQDAALATLRIQRRALDMGMSLKDASAYNIQFIGSKPMLIDTLSFEAYREGEPWVAYGQFCRHFLAPLALMSYVDVRLDGLLRTYIDGVPLSLAGRLLPGRTRLRFGLLSHIHLHAGAERRTASRPVDVPNRRFSRNAMLGLVDNLAGTVRGLKWQPKGTPWAGYYAATNYSAAAMEHKAQLVAEFLAAIEPAPALAWDLGANTGRFGRIVAERGAYTVAFDNDPACVERSYREGAARGEANVLPLLLDLTNPSPNVGWANEERMSLLQRAPADVALALALVHHLAIGNNLPLSRIAAFLARACHVLIIEFVPKSDSQVQRLLATRQDIFPNYTQEAFEAEFGRHFTIERQAAIRESERTLYLMRRRPLA